ncbi:CAP domain-containing protein [Leptolyngbya sp. Cla-17]|uniref:CAP domain-containing protein n=1 Tax=Leptolyngbya sp. Cla-17 TaxID=2803751 RepID=UPI001F5DA1E9|nr:CAP domain-containing protein [Leptolyngbya sp. Cla-17]
MALALVNRDRQLNGLLPLVEDPLLSQSSQQHSQDMMSRNYYAHVTPEGRTPTDRFTQVGGRGGVGENIMQQTGGTGISLSYGLIEAFQKAGCIAQDIAKTC